MNHDLKISYNSRLKFTNIVFYASITQKESLLSLIKSSNFHCNLVSFVSILQIMYYNGSQFTIIPQKDINFSTKKLLAYTTTILMSLATFLSPRLFWSLMSSGEVFSVISFTAITKLTFSETIKHFMEINGLWTSKTSYLKLNILQKR